MYVSLRAQNMFGSGRSRRGVESAEEEEEELFRKLTHVPAAREDDYLKIREESNIIYDAILDS